MENIRTGYQRYPQELKERAINMVCELKQSDPKDNGVIARVARQLGIGPEPIRIRVTRAEIEDGKRPGKSESERSELASLCKEVRELRRANDIMQATATFFGAELDRRSKK
jgi:transposase-like protein